MRAGAGFDGGRHGAGRVERVRVARRDALALPAGRFSTGGGRVLVGFGAAAEADVRGRRVRVVLAVVVELVRARDAVEIVRLEQEAGLDAGAHARIGRGGAVVVVEQVVASVAEAGRPVPTAVPPP